MTTKAGDRLIPPGMRVFQVHFDLAARFERTTHHYSAQAPDRLLLLLGQ
jgi:hypothetical protein